MPLPEQKRSESREIATTSACLLHGPVAELGVPRDRRFVAQPCVERERVARVERSRRRAPRRARSPDCGSHRRSSSGTKVHARSIVRQAASVPVKESDDTGRSRRDGAHQAAQVRLHALHRPEAVGRAAYACSSTMPWSPTATVRTPTRAPTTSSPGSARAWARRRFTRATASITPRSSSPVRPRPRGSGHWKTR